MMTLPDLTHAPGATRVLKRIMTFYVRFALHSGICETLEGPVNFNTGDAIITGSEGEKWPVERGKFFEFYAPSATTNPGKDGDYVTLPKKANAICLRSPVTVPAGASHNQIAGAAGDWLLQYDGGSYGIVKSTLFNRHFEVVNLG